MGRGCCETYGDIPHDHEEEIVQEPLLTAPELPAEITKTVITSGAGSYPRKGDEVRVHYTGWLQSTGAKFDSSLDRGQLFTFTLGAGQVIRGWDLGVATMQCGEKSRFLLPAAFAYGASGSPPTIPPNATLEFEVELFSFGGKDLFKDGRAIFRFVQKSTDWKTPREGDEVVFLLSDLKTNATSHTHTLNQTTSTSPLSVALLDALLAELKTGDRVHVALSAAEAKNNNNLEAFELELAEIHKVDDVSFTAGARRVFKKTLTAGAGYQSPELQSSVTVAVEVTNADGFILASSDAVKFVLGEARASELLEAAVAKMTLNEVALVWSPLAEVEVVQHDLELNYPVEAGLQFTVTLREFTETKAYFDRSPEEKLALGEWLKEAGSRVLKQGRLQLAVDKYKMVLKMFEFKGAEVEGVAALVKACQLNLAMCLLKLGDWRAAKDEADKVLKEDTDNVKALFRKATALHKLGEFVEAEAALKKLVEVDGENGEAKQLLAVVKDAVKKDNDKQKNLFGRMFKAVGRD